MLLKETKNQNLATEKVMFEYEKTEDYQLRLSKLDYIRSAGVNPYPHKFLVTHSLQEAIEQFDSKEIGDSEKAEAGLTPEISISGRLVLFRAMGKNAFAQLQGENLLHHAHAFDMHVRNRYVEPRRRRALRSAGAQQQR